MTSPALQQYLQHLQQSSPTKTNIRLDAQGQALGRYFHSTLTSTFQAIRAHQDQRVVAYDGYVRSYAEDGEGLNIWKLLETHANDDESVELDRLCRILHTINFYQQASAAAPEADLFLTIHTRLLAAVEGNHGAAFRRILHLLELPQDHIVLQLPHIIPNQRWMLQHVADGYRRNGFKIGVHANDILQALELLAKVRPDAIKMDVRQIITRDADRKPTQHESLRTLIKHANQIGSRLIFKRIETEQQLDSLTQLLEDVSDLVPDSRNETYFLQGFLLDTPKAVLAATKDIARAA